MQFTEELRNRLMRVDPAQIGHYIEGGYMCPEIKPVFKSAKMAGPACTVRLAANDSAMLYYAMERAPKGSVIVIDRAGDSTYACCGDIVTLCAQQLGHVGIVIDGPATDSLGIEKLQFPVFSRGISPVTTKLLGISGQCNIPVQCGGIVVNPGDVVFGDADGVIVLTVAQCDELIAKAEAANAQEVVWREQIRAGKKMSELVNIDRLVANDFGAYNAELKTFTSLKTS